MKRRQGSSRASERWTSREACARMRCALAAALSCFLAATLAGAQGTGAYPSRPVRVIVQSPPGGSPDILAGEMLNVLAGVNTTHVPCKGAALAMIDLIGGQLQFLITSPLVAMPHARAGRVKVLATTGAQRDPLLPELPVVADTVPGYEIVQWWGLGVPAGTPQAIVKTLHAELMKTLNDAQTREAMSKNGATAKPESPAEFATFVKGERERIARIAKQAKISVD